MPLVESEDPIREREREAERESATEKELASERERKSESERQKVMSAPLPRSDALAVVLLKALLRLY